MVAIINFFSYCVVAIISSSGIVLMVAACAEWCFVRLELEPHPPPPKEQRPHRRATRATREHEMARLKKRLGDEGFAREVATSTTMGRKLRKQLDNHERN